MDRKNFIITSIGGIAGALIAPFVFKNESRIPKNVATVDGYANPVDISNKVIDCMKLERNKFDLDDVRIVGFKDSVVRGDNICGVRMDHWNRVGFSLGKDETDVSVVDNHIRPIAVAIMDNVYRTVRESDIESPVVVFGSLELTVDDANRHRDAVGIAFSPKSGFVVSTRVRSDIGVRSVAVDVIWGVGEDSEIPDMA